MASFFCALGFHKWSDWKVVKRGEVSAPSTRRPVHQRVIAETLVQERHCEVCKLIETKTTKIDLI